MKRNILIFGIIAGIIVAGTMLYSSSHCYKDDSYTPSMILGYTSMILAFSLIFVGVKNYRDKYNGGLVSFGQAFKIGLFIALIASSIYVMVWLIEFYMFIPDFMDRFAAHTLMAARNGGATAAEMAKKTAEMNSYKEMYKNPIFVILMTYLEILPIGLIVSVIVALILKKRKTA